MATPGQLVKAAADILGIEEVTAGLHYRRLREAGLVTKGGRGASAAKMTPRDAAHLLISLVGGELAKDAAETVREFNNLQSARVIDDELVREYGGDAVGLAEGTVQVNTKWRLGPINLPGLGILPNRHSFGDTLTAILQSAVDGSLYEAAAANPWKQGITPRAPNGGITMPAIGISLRTDWFGVSAKARIECADYETYMEYFRPWEGEEKQKQRYSRKLYDLRTERTFTEETIIAVGKVLGESGSKS